MSRSCIEWRGDIGAYIVGALDDRARDRVTRHLAECAGCRADYDELVPVRACLGRLAHAAFRPEPGAGQPRARARAWPRTVPRRARRCLAAGAALVAAAAFLAVLVIPGPAARSFRAADSATGVSGRVELRGMPTGTRIDLTASGLPGGERCILIAVARDGTDIAGSWNATEYGSAEIAGTTEFPASRLTALRIESDTGLVLLSIRV
jgi:Putative zinc-finger